MISSDALVLGIETSCDETAAAVVQGGRKIVSAFVASQVDLHRRFGGVVPEVACRAHMECLLPGIREALQDAGIRPHDLAGIAVTHQPGLIGALLVGVSAAKSLALAWGIPLVGVDHVQAHVTACRLAEAELTHPFVALVASGGHTHVFRVSGPDDYQCLHQTRDDAAGEAFDKAAKILELGFPGGPAIERAAQGGTPTAHAWKNACLPDGGRDFSFSGIKTGLLYAARGQNRGRNAPLQLGPGAVRDAAASFQHAVVHALVARTVDAASASGVSWIALGGGVAANTCLRQTMAEAARARDCRLAVPSMDLCTDNAVMVAARGYERLRDGPPDGLELAARARRA